MNNRHCLRRARRLALLTTLVSLTSLVLATPASAQDEAPSGVTTAAGDAPRAREDTLETARTVGMGSGARATSTGTAALAQNPANMALARLYHIEANLQYVTGQNAFSVGSAVVDSVSNRLAAGMSMRGLFGNGRDYSGWDARLGLGMALTPQIALGLSGRYVRLPPRRRDDNGAAIGESARGFTMDAALTVTPIEWLHLSATAHNIIDIGSALTPVQLGGSAGIRLAETGLAIGADFLFDLSTFENTQLMAGVGAEYVISDLVPLRIGYRRDRGRDLHSLTMSIGYLDPRMGVDLAMRTDIGGSDRQTDLLLSFRYHVQ